MECMFTTQGEMMCPRTPANRNGVFDKTAAPPEHVDNPAVNTFASNGCTIKNQYDKKIINYYIQPQNIITHFDKSCQARNWETI